MNSPPPIISLEALWDYLRRTDAENKAQLRSIDQENHAALIEVKDLNVKLERHLGACEMLAKECDNRRAERNERTAFFGSIPSWVSIIIGAAAICTTLYLALRPKDSKPEPSKISAPATIHKQVKPLKK